MESHSAGNRQILFCRTGTIKEGTFTWTAQEERYF
jgi:hypothetical protein